MQDEMMMAAAALVAVRAGGTVLLLAGAWYLLHPDLAPRLRRFAAASFGRRG